jgi:hypothetical protein
MFQIDSNKLFFADGVVHHENPESAESANLFHYPYNADHLKFLNIKITKKRYLASVYIFI